MRRKAYLIGGALVLVAGAAVGAALGLGGGTAGPAGPSHPATAAQVKRETLVQYVTVDGAIGFGPAQPLASKATGTVTWLAAEGTTVQRGKPLLRVDDQPVVLLFGLLPPYRDLSVGTEGSDVVQLETNLKALGYTGFTADRQFSASTAAAVKRWQADLGLAETGTVGVGQIAYAPGPLRVAEQLVRVGAATPADVLDVTGTTKVVTASVPVADAGWAARGAKVSLALPGGATVPGLVQSVDEPGATSGDGAAAGNPAVSLTITVADQQALAADRGAVTVRYTAQERADVLTVPVAALLALAEGGYGVELDGGGIVAVRVGMFAGGRVEVSGGGLAEGTSVRVPQ